MTTRRQFLVASGLTAVSSALGVAGVPSQPSGVIDTAVGTPSRFYGPGSFDYLLLGSGQRTFLTLGQDTWFIRTADGSSDKPLYRLLLRAGDEYLIDDGRLTFRTGEEGSVWVVA